MYLFIISYFVWNILDDDEEPTEAEKESQEEEDEELDPLDAYMEEVKEEVKKFNMGSMKGGNEKVGIDNSLMAAYNKPTSDAS